MLFLLYCCSYYIILVLFLVSISTVDLVNRTDYGKISYLKQRFISCQSHTSSLAEIILHSALFWSFLGVTWKGKRWVGGFCVVSVGFFPPKVPWKFFWVVFLLELWNGKLWSTQTVDIPPVGKTASLPLGHLLPPVCHTWGRGCGSGQEGRVRDRGFSPALCSSSVRPGS